MGKYYKGNIINVTKIPEFLYHLNIIRTNSYDGEPYKYYVADDSSKKAYLYFKRFGNKELGQIEKDLLRLTDVNAPEELKAKYDNMIADAFKMNADNVPGTNIIYEKLYDEEGNTYGKELITGNIFPINSKYSSYDISYSEDPIRKLFFECKKGKVYNLEAAIGNVAFYIVDANGEKYNIDGYDHAKLKRSFDLYTTYDVYTKGRVITLTLVHPTGICICVEPKMKFPSNQRIEYAIAGETLANELEVNSYIKNLENGFGKRKRKKEYVKLINEKSTSNYLGENINFVTNGIVKERVNEEVITKEMQELEFVLSRLKSVSEEDYRIINNEYNEVLNHENNGLYINPLTVSTIISLQNKAELAFMCHGGNSKRILDYLNKQASIYLENYKNNTSDLTELSISDLDKISEHFLCSKNSYSYKEQNEILRNLALLYFFEIYENKDILTSNDLENSYVNDNIKRIITIISVLKEEGIIKDIPNTIYDITNLDELLDFIKKIELNTKEKLEDKDASILIKKLQR